MPLVRVDQGHNWNGCFVACVATLTSTSYEQAFKLLFPKRKFEAGYHGIKRMKPEAPAHVAYRKLRDLGLQPKKTNRVQFSKLTRTALYIIRWSFANDLLHAVIWDHESKKILDPSTSYPMEHKEYEKQLEAVYYVEPKSYAVSSLVHHHQPNNMALVHGRPHEGRFIDPFDSGYAY